MATDTLTGLKITDVRPMTDDELAREGWSNEPGMHAPPPVIELEDGRLLYASRDAEGNGPGALFGADPDGKLTFISAERSD